MCLDFNPCKDSVYCLSFSLFTQHLLAFVMPKASPSDTKADIVVRNGKVAHIFSGKVLATTTLHPQLWSQGTEYSLASKNMEITVYHNIECDMATGKW